MPGEEIVTTPFGKFLIDPRDIIGSTLKAGTCWDGPGFLQVIASQYAQLGVDGQTVIDVGANQGAFTMWLASQGCWRVVAVEPVPPTMQRLKANLDLNREMTADRVVTIEVAAYYERTVLYMPGAIDCGNTGGTTVVPAHKVPGDLATVPILSVEARPLDDYDFLWHRGVSLVKIDAQGCDGRAIQGLERTLEKHKPVIVFEWERELAEAHGLSLSALINWLTVYDYWVCEWPSHPNNFLALPKGVL